MKRVLFALLLAFGMASQVAQAQSGDVVLLADSVLIEQVTSNSTCG